MRILLLSTLLLGSFTSQVFADNSFKENLRKSKEAAQSRRYELLKESLEESASKGLAECWILKTHYPLEHILRLAREENLEFSERGRYYIIRGW